MAFILEFSRTFDTAGEFIVMVGKQTYYELYYRTLAGLAKQTWASYMLMAGKEEIGTVYKADGRIKKFRPLTDDLRKRGKVCRLGPASPYDEGFSTHREATIELGVLKHKSPFDSNMAFSS